LTETNPVLELRVFFGGVRIVVLTTGATPLITGQLTVTWTSRLG
jgi:hypothetical protein